MSYVEPVPISAGSLHSVGPASGSAAAQAHIVTGRWLVAGLGVIVVIAGVYFAWLAVSHRGREFARSHDRNFRRQPPQNLTTRQSAVVRVFTLACAGLFVVGGIIVIVVAFVQPDT